MTKEISIYVPVFNGEKTIKQCLDSIFNQTLVPNKILVINDNSIYIREFFFIVLKPCKEYFKIRFIS